MNSPRPHRRHQLFRRLAVMLVLGALSATAGPPAAAGSPGAREAVVSVKGMACAMCARGLESRLSKLGDATAAKVHLEKEQAIVTFPPETKVTDKQIEKTVNDAGFNVVRIEWRTAGENGGSTGPADAAFAIGGMHCERCAANLARVLQQHPGVTSAGVDFAGRIARVTYEPATTDSDAIAGAIDSLGVFSATLLPAGPAAGSKQPGARRTVRK